MNGPRFDVYQDTAGEWRWRLRAANGRIVAESGEGYVRESGAKAAIDNVRRLAGRARRQVLRKAKAVQS